jgi:hypothetical protein
VNVARDGLALPLYLPALSAAAVLAFSPVQAETRVDAAHVGEHDCCFRLVAVAALDVPTGPQPVPAGRASESR